ncbi:hypothetical protein ABVT39_003352 [Epinephelus coioides]
MKCRSVFRVEIKSVEFIRTILRHRPQLQGSTELHHPNIQLTVVSGESGVVFPFTSSESHERRTTETLSDLTAWNSGNLPKNIDKRINQFEGEENILEMKRRMMKKDVKAKTFVPYKCVFAAV